MDIWGAILVLVRRFYITVPLVAIAIVLAWVYSGSVAPEYHASAYVVLIGPTATATKDIPQPTNTLESLGTTTVESALQIAMSSGPTRQQFAQAGNSTNYSIGTSKGSPILSISATSTSAQQAFSTVSQAITVLQATLFDRQKQQTPLKVNQITLQVLSQPILGPQDTKGKKKTLTIVSGVGVVLAILLTLVGDAIIRNRSQRRNSADWDAQTLEDDDKPAAAERAPIVRP